MLYAVISEDVADSLSKRLGARAAHLARLGPHPAIDREDPGEAGFTGSLIIAEFPSLQDAQQWADSDPYIEAGVYAKVTVKPYKKVLP